MQELRIPLDTGAHHTVRLALDANGGRAWLEHDAGDLRSPLHEALARHLRLSAVDVARFDEADTLRFTGPLSSIDLCGLVLWDGSPRYVLSPIECRFLSDNGLPHPADGEAASACVTPQTDLHSHFAACLRGEDLMELGAAHDVTVPRALLGELGVRSERAAEHVRLAELPEDLRARCGRRLGVPHDRQITFLEMERLYRLRAPLTKHPRLFVPQLERIAADYARAGVEYAELSLSDIVRGDVLRAVHRELPAIEARYGVKLRFLAALSRHNDVEWDLDVVDRLEVIAPSRYVVGVDVMGHETNPTLDFARSLEEIVTRMPARRPGFVVRVHAGESPAHPANVRDAVELARGHDVRLRIGHGLHGVDDETIALLSAARIVVEFNLTSNFSLNNVQSLADVPLVRYAAAGVPVVLGSDGPGLYGTDARLEARAARLAGLGEDALRAIRAHETRYIEERLALDAASTRADFVVPGDLVHRHYGPEVAEGKRRVRRQRDARLESALDTMHIERLDAEGLDRMLRGRRCVSIAGSWKHAWAATPEAARALVVRELEALVEGLHGTVLVTGGTRFGVEHEVQRVARALGVEVVSGIVSETPPDALSPDVRFATVVAETLYGKAAGLYELVRQYDGACVFIGGGSIVNDEIQTARNLRLPILLMDGPPGASTRQAREQPHAAFRLATEALERLATSGTRPLPFWHAGPNPTADVVLVRRDGGRIRVLAIRRDLDAPCEPGRWALPGGFVQTDAARGEAWRPGKESSLSAALRELEEETGLDLKGHARVLQNVGVYEGGDRDPRDRPSAWSRSTVFAGVLPDALGDALIAGGDDACDARWLELDAVSELAFDHAVIVREALQRMEP